MKIYILLVTCVVFSFLAYGQPDPLFSNVATKEFEENAKFDENAELSEVLNRLVIMYDFLPLHQRLGLALPVRPDSGPLHDNLVVFKKHAKLVEPILVQYLETAAKPTRVHYAIHLLEEIGSAAGKRNVLQRQAEMVSKGLPARDSDPEMVSLPIAFERYLGFCNKRAEDIPKK